MGEAKKIATLADAWGRPVAPHDCTGPVVLTASVHLSLNCPNTLVQETVRAFTNGWYQEVMTELPDIREGFVYPSQAGIGYCSATGTTGGGGLRAADDLGVIRAAGSPDVRCPPRVITRGPAMTGRGSGPSSAGIREPHLHGRYRASSGTTLMLLNGEPLISLVLTTV